MAVIRKFKIGNTKIVIHDDCCAKTEEEKKKVLDGIANIVATYLPNGVEKDEPMEFEDSIYEIGIDDDWSAEGVMIYEGTKARNKGA